jgi:hypothetical protein
MALCRPLLLAVDGLASYVSAFRDAFRSKFPRQAGETGRCKMVSWSDIYIVQVVKQRAESVPNVERRIVQGTKERVESLIQRTQGKGVINTAFIERLNATFRQRISPLTRRTRNLAQQAETLVAGMYIVGCFYNFCDYHHSLRLKLSIGSFGYHWVQRTPAIVAKLTDHHGACRIVEFQSPATALDYADPSRQTLCCYAKTRSTMGCLTTFKCGDTSSQVFHLFCTKSLRRQLPHPNFRIKIKHAIALPAQVSLFPIF